MKRQSLKHLFIRIPTLCYKFAWLPTDYTTPIPDYGTLSNQAGLNSDDYADNPAQELSKYRVKELLELYEDSLPVRRRRNMVYTMGPTALEDTGTDQFSFKWSLWSPPNPSGGVKFAKDPYTSVMDYATTYPAYAGIISGYKGIMSATFDLSATPVLAWESAANQISVLRVVEGLTTFEGYSPILFCNAAYVDDPENQTDAVVFYLKDINGYSGIWNYNTLFNPAYQFPDSRRGTAIYFRVQRDNFGVEYKMCDTGFEVQYLDNVTFSGNPYAAQEGDTFKQALSLVDGLCNRFTALSGQYFFPPPPDPHIPANASDSTTITLSASGLLFNVVASSSASDSIAVSLTASGVLMDVVVNQTATETSTLTLTPSGALLNVVELASVSDSTTLTATPSGALVQAIGGSTTQTDSAAIGLTPSGSLETV